MINIRRHRKTRSTLLKHLAAPLAAATLGSALMVAVPTAGQQPPASDWPSPSVSAEPGSSSMPATGGLESAVVRTIEMPAAFATKVSTSLELKYQDTPGVHVSPDARGGRLVILAPESLQRQIHADAMQCLVSESQPGASQVGLNQAASAANPAALRVGVRTDDGQLQMRLSTIDWRQFEQALGQVAGKRVPVTTSNNGNRALFRLTGAPLDGTTIEVNRQENLVTVVAPEPAMPGWRQLVRAIDRPDGDTDDMMELVRLEHAKPAPIQRALRLLDQLGNKESAKLVPGPGDGNLAVAMVQQQPQDDQDDPVDPDDPDAQPQVDPEMVDEAAAGIIGDAQIQFIPELGTIIVRGTRRDAQRVLEVIRQIEAQAVLTQPEVEVYQLRHINSNAAAELLETVYEEVLSARRGEVNIKSLDNPNALMLIGRREAVANAMELVEKLDRPLEPSSRLRVFRLEHASATDAEERIREFFADRPGVGDEQRPGLGTRVRVLADYRTNSLIVGASPRDLGEVAGLIRDLDVASTSARNEIKLFSLRHSRAIELAPVLQAAINGTGDFFEENPNATRAAKSLSLLSLSPDGESLIESGILTGVTVTADANSNSLIVNGPSASMSLIGELIRQLDQLPGLESVVKVFTIENGEAGRLAELLRLLFGQAGQQGQAGQAEGQAAVAATTAAPGSSLVTLRFATDVRSNSIIATGAASDMDVVESILLRLDTAGFTERITEVIWLRHQRAPEIAAAIQQYVQQRQQGLVQASQLAQQQQQPGPLPGIGAGDIPDMVVVAEEVTNSLLLSVSPRLYQDVRQLVESLDRRPPMVLIKVVLAEVFLDDQFELGGELGLQDSLLFDRSVATAPPIPELPTNAGFNFNRSGTPNAGVVNPGTVGSRALSTFGVGTSNTALGYGGFVLSAASDSFNMLFRSLQQANRGQILSRPQVMVVDNEVGFVQVGQQVARVRGLTQQLNVPPILNVDDIDIGLILQVRPRVGSDGLISMQILAERSDIVDQQEGTVIGTTSGPDGTATPVVVPNIQRTAAESTIIAYDGQTVIFGGLIQKERTNISRRVPYLSQIPLLGVMFRFDGEAERRSELLVIMTPTLVTGDEDLEYVKQVESGRMSYCLADVIEMHGDVGLSGGYGLWGPAVGPTIYPDLHPTVDQFPQAEPDEHGSPILEDQPLLPPGGEPEQPTAPEAIEPAQPLPQSASRNAPKAATVNDSSAGPQAGGLVLPADFQFIDGDTAAQAPAATN